MCFKIRKIIERLFLLAVLIPSSSLGFLEEDGESIKSPIRGIVTRIAVASGQQVKKGDFLFEVECMKMFFSIWAPRAGFIDHIDLKEREVVDKDESLFAVLSFIPEKKDLPPTDKNKSILPVPQTEKPTVQQKSDSKKEIATFAPKDLDSKNSVSCFSLPGIMITFPAKSERKPTMPKVMSRQEKFIFENEIASQISPQSQQEWISSWIPVVITFGEVETRSFYDEVGIPFSSQKVHMKESGKETNSARTPNHLPCLTGFLLLGFLFFRRSEQIIPYQVKSILSTKPAENINTLRDLRDAA